jgi:inorganic phosphate transporter, PiT family
MAAADIRGDGMSDNAWDVRRLEQGLLVNRAELFRLGTALLFIVVIMIVALARGPEGPGGILLVTAAMIGGYMALNIGANDVANNVGPAVGSRAITLTGAILIAAVFEAAGALIAGGDVVGTIKSGIIEPAMIEDPNTFIWLMMAGLLSAALWLNFATAVGAPVSTTHAIVGGVLGAGVAAGGWGIANWGVVGQIAASWVISPVLGGVIAAGFLYLIKRTITYQPDLLVAARRMAPVLIAVMGWAFTTYLALKGLNQIISIGFLTASVLGLVVAAVVWALMRRHVERVTPQLTNDKEGVNALFTIPLIFAAALLSFAHGANDVANAVGPLAGISEAVMQGEISGKAPIPLWVMLVGAIGIVLGLALYGPKLIRTVGSEITELDKARAFCVALAAAITVIIASQLGLPVSSTHIAVGGVFGVGFLREYLKVSYSRMIADIREHHRDDNGESIDAFISRFEAGSVKERGDMLRKLKSGGTAGALHKNERKGLQKIQRIELVKRTLLLRIAAAWVVTVPASAILSAMIFFMLRGALLP